jgi:hypothetical protein
LRCVALGKEHDIKLVTKSICDVWHADFECRGDITPEDWPDLEAWADVIVFQGFLLHEVPMLIGSSKVIVVDLYDPFHLEQLELSRHDPLDLRARSGESVRVLNQRSVEATSSCLPTSSATSGSANARPCSA